MQPCILTLWVACLQEVNIVIVFFISGLALNTQGVDTYLPAIAVPSWHGQLYDARSVHTSLAVASPDREMLCACMMHAHLAVL